MMTERSPQYQHQQHQQSLFAPPLEREQSYDTLDFEGDEVSSVVSSGSNNFGSDSLKGEGQEQEHHEERGGGFVEEPLSDGGSELGGLEPVSESGEEAEATANSYDHLTQADGGEKTQQERRAEKPAIMASAPASARRLSTEFDDRHSNELFLDGDQAGELEEAPLPTIAEPPHSPKNKKSELRGSPARARSARVRGPSHNQGGNKHGKSRAASHASSPRPKSAPMQSKNSDEGEHARADLTQIRKNLQNRSSYHSGHISAIEKTIKRLENMPVSCW